MLVGDTQTGDYHLQIREVKMEDEGMYRCDNLDLTPKEAKLTAIVPVPRPPLLKGSENPSKVGQELVLRCLSSGGHPLPELTWFNGTRAFTGQQVIRQGGEGQVEVELVIPQLTKWDNGMNLTCRASQPFPEIAPVQESWSILRVHYAPVVSVPITRVSVVEGETAILTCLVDSSPTASISWIKFGHTMPLVQDIRKQTLRIINATRYDPGMYQCSAENEILPIGVGTVTLEVFYPPFINPSMEKKVTVQQGNDGFSLECLVDGNPEPQVRWRRKDTNLYWENPLRFHRVSFGVEGTYQCVATSDGFPLESKDTFIDVVGKPLMRRTIGSSSISAVAGEAVRISCTVAADPLPSKIDWIWRNDDGVETKLSASVSRNIVITEDGQGITSTLTIPDVTVKDSGNYICTASNVFGSARRNIRLDISESVPRMAIITSVTAGAILLVTTAAVMLIFAKKRGWICKSHIDEPFRVPVCRPMPPVPKYVYKTGTIDSGVEDLQELQEMYGTLKPRPPPRMDTGWTSSGLPNAGLVHSTSLPPYSTDEWARRYGAANWNVSPLTLQLVGDTKQGEYHLQIRDVRMEDEGRYRCAILDLTPEEAKLTVVDAPVVSALITTVSVVEGKPAILTCLVDSSPTASIGWRKLGHQMPLMPDIRKQTLRMANITRHDAGIYQCSAENGISPIGVGTVTLEVLYPPLIDPSMEKSVTVQQGNGGFSLECLVDGSPEPRVRWRRKNTNLYWENPLRFHRVSYDVEGTYQCVATSEGFPLKAKDTFIDVVGKPLVQRKLGASTISAVAGEAARISCTFVADPLPSTIDWIWRNDDGVEKELSASVNSKLVITEDGQGMTSTLTIPDVTVKDSGNYICTASNVFGSARQNIRLDITEPFRVPVSRPMPPVPKYVYKTGTIDSGVEDLQELQEMYGTLKPRPLPRVYTEWTSAEGLDEVHSTSLPPYPTDEWARRYEAANWNVSPITVQSVAVASVASEVYE
ncbi:HMCN2 [Branchiostoma lanceolatum]|uniref:HMCN2 protein n=1 Tax=Branchiostoma lanceolatum TaxID=7740 RepID=A0A8J9VXN8_BRALA|nr:HMCN2 [Branchiostoma lanceolatum]